MYINTKRTKSLRLFGPLVGLVDLKGLRPVPIKYYGHDFVEKLRYWRIVNRHL